MTNKKIYEYSDIPVDIMDVIIDEKIDSGLGHTVVNYTNMNYTVKDTDVYFLNNGASVGEEILIKLNW